MELIQLSITDFGVYKGKVSFDLSPKCKPIIIFGGKNGSGKTTLLEAIKLCLYGSRALGYKTGRKEYEEHIRNRIHRQRKAIVPLNHTSISLSYNYSLLGKEQKYEVTRSWKIRSDSLEESLLILLNEKPLSNIPEESWQDFIDDLIPPSVADLFFFDGEKIQELIIDNFDESTLANEVKSLLGLNIIEKIQADLDTYLYRQRKENANAQNQQKIEIAEAEFKKSDQQYQLIFQQLAHNQNEIVITNNIIEKMEKEINRESSGYAFQRESLKSQLIKTETELEEIKKQFLESAAGLLPFALVPELCQELKNQLLLEEKYQQWQASTNILNPKILTIKETIESNEFWTKVNGQLPKEIKQEMVSKISLLLDELLDTDISFKNTRIIHKISEPEKILLLSLIDESEREVPKKIKLMNTKLIQLEQRRHEITLKLRNVPSDDILKPLIEKINQLNQQLGEYNAKASQLEVERGSLYIEREDAAHRLQKTFDTFRFGKRFEERNALIERTQKVLNDYMFEVTRRKIILLENLVKVRFNELVRKPDLLDRVTIDPQSFSIRLFDSENNEESKGLLSAGEKQMFAISLLWSLRELSGKPFPVIIDTPLGRLDSDHRENLINRYFPKVSHQVILFSTDTEIDRSYFADLEPQISHTYLLEYDSNSGSTNASMGYFWKEKQDAT